MPDKKRINYDAISNPHLLVDLLNNIDAEIDEIRAIANETRTDVAAAHVDLTAIETLINELKSDMNAKHALEDWRYWHDGIISGKPGLCVGTGVSTKVKVAGFIRFVLQGKIYVIESGTETTLAGGTHDITANKFGAWAFEANLDGTVTSVAANGGGGDMAYDTLEDALLNLSTQARTANTVDLGYLVIEAAAGGFTIGTDDPETGDAQVTAATYFDVACRLGDNGIRAALGSATECTAGAMTIDRGTIDPDVNGIGYAQIALDATMGHDDVDQVTNGGWGAWFILVDYLGTGVYLLAADGVAGSASTMNYADKVACDAALDTLEDQLPMLVTPVSRIYLDNTGGANAWVMGTDNWDHDTAVATAEDYGVTHVNQGYRKQRSSVRPSNQEDVAAPDISHTITDIAAGAVTEKVDRQV